MKDKLIKVLLEGDEDKDLLEELQSLIDDQPKECNQYKVLSNLYMYLKYTQDNEISLTADISDSFTPMAAASLRAMGFVQDTARDENIATLILQSAQMAWIINREFAKSILN